MVPVPGVDLEVTGLSLLSEPVASQPLDVRADVRNNGPGVTTGLLTFVVQGNVTLGEVAASCADATVPQGSVTIENLGPDTAPGATLMLSATGDVTRGGGRGATPVAGLARLFR